MGRWSEENPNPHAIYPRIYTASSPHTTYNRALMIIMYLMRIISVLKQ